MNDFNWFGLADINSCAQHIEAKILANKLWRQYCSAGDRLEHFVFKEISENNFNDKKFEGLLKNIDKYENAFNDIIRGLKKCCVPK